MMTCGEFRESFERAIEERQLPPAEVVAHAATCQQQDCQTLWREYQVLERAVAAWRRPASSPELADRVMGRLTPQAVPAAIGPASAPTRRSLRVAAIATLVSIACLLVAIWPGSQPREVNPVAVVTPDREASPAPEELEELGSVYVRWMQGATTRVSDTVAFMLLEEEPVGREASPSSSWLKTWGERLEPLEESLDNTFRSLIGGSDKSQTSLPTHLSPVS